MTFTGNTAVAIKNSPRLFCVLNQPLKIQRRGYLKLFLSIIINERKRKMINSKKIVSLFTAAAMTAGVFALSVNAEEEPKAVSILYAAQKDGEFIDVPHYMTVTDGIAEEYGYDVIAKDIDEPTFLDALVTASKEKYGDKFTKETASQYLAVNDYGFLTTMYQNPASATGYYINSKSSAASNQAVINDGDSAELFFYQDTAGYSDKYTFFDAKEKTVKTGESFDLTLTMSGYDENWQTVESPVDGTSDKNAVTINTVNADGSISEPLEASIDANGKVSLKFDEPGTYIVTAQGFVNETNPIVAPICIVTMYQSPFSISEDGTVEVKLDNVTSADLVIAKYNEEKRFVSAQTSKLDFNDGKAVSDKKAENGDVITVWNTLNNMEPVTAAEVAKY